MALHGNEKKYDKDGDGRLNSRERWDWYFGTFGHDLEREERRQKQACEAAVQTWVQEALTVLCQCWADALWSVQTVASNDAALSALVRKAMAYEMLSGLLAGGRWSWTVSGGTGETVARYAFMPVQQLLQAFLEQRSTPCTFDSVRQTVVGRNYVPFEQEGRLQKGGCGIFWQRLIDHLDTWDGETEPPDEVARLLQAMGDAYRLLSNGQQDTEPERLRRAFLTQWQLRSAERCRLLGELAGKPEAAAAEDAVRRWDFSKNPDACRTFLVASFPDAARSVPARELLELDADDFLCQTYSRDPELAVAMWRKLLDTAESHLCEEDPAQWLLEEALYPVWRGSEPMDAVLAALRSDDRFARQIFQSAFVGDPQEAILRACGSAGDAEQKSRLEELLAHNLYVLTDPDPSPARAKELLQRGALQRGVDLCRVILLDAFPQPDAPAGASWEQLVRAKLDDDPSLGLAMWRTLLDIAEPCLASSRETAETLLPDYWIRWKWLRQNDAGHLQPFLDALQDERFARQVFQSASVSALQANLLRACHQLGRETQGAALLALLQLNPLPQSQWRVSLKDCEQGLREGLVSREVPRSAAAAEEAGAVYRYCTVQVPGVDRAYSYLTGDIPVEAGDWVEVPFGRRQEIRRGQVVTVQECDRASAPWPPEKTKRVLRLAAVPEPQPAERLRPVREAQRSDEGAEARRPDVPSDAGTRDRNRLGRLALLVGAGLLVLVLCLIWIWWGH